MKLQIYIASALALAIALGLSVRSADAGSRHWRAPAWVGRTPAWFVGPAMYSYDGYKPPPMYYRAYYGDYRPVRAHERGARRHSHVVHTRG